MEASESQDRAREAMQTVATAPKPMGQKPSHLFVSGVQEEKGKEGGEDLSPP